MFGRNIKNVSYVKHLGRFLSSSDNLTDIKTVIKDIKIGRNIIINNNCQSATTITKVKVFNSQCMTLNGGPFWNLQDINVLFKKMACMFITTLHPKSNPS